MILLDYLAVHEKRRSQGVGSAMLQALLEKYAGRGLFVEIEAADRDDPDGSKLRRKQYIKKRRITGFRNRQMQSDSNLMFSDSDSVFIMYHLEPKTNAVASATCEAMAKKKIIREYGRNI